MIQRSPMAFSLSAGIAILERTPRVLRAMLDGMPREWTDATEGPATWSPFDVARHLIHAERTDSVPPPRIILAPATDRRFTPFDRFAQSRDSAGRSLAQLLDDLARLRAGSVATLAEWRLTDDQLALEGEHPEFGAVTLRQLLATWVAHALSHIAQIARVMT